MTAAAAASTDTPLIYTTKGNVPISSLEHYVKWDKTDDYIKFTEVYKDASGEVVKESAHVHVLKGAEMGAETATMA